MVREYAQSLTVIQHIASDPSKPVWAWRGDKNAAEQVNVKAGSTSAVVLRHYCIYSL